jgi:uncharacterized glyoxalase superfamily protein PhnB
MSMSAATPTIKPAAVKPIPDGYHTITPGLIVKDAGKAIDYYKKALGATEVMKMACHESGKIMHAELKVGDSVFSLCEEMPGMCGATSSSFYLYVNDCDAAFKRAIDGGMTVKMPVTEMFWGDRVGKATDSYGNTWGFATHVKNLSESEILAGQKVFAEQMKAKMASGGCSSSKPGSCG